MFKIVNGDEVIARGNSVGEIIDEMNSGAENGNEWYFVYRPDAGVVNGYLDASEEEANADLDGEKADAIYDVVEYDESEDAITVEGEDGGETVLHLLRETERNAYDYDEIIGELYDTAEGVTVIYNDASNEYSIARE